MEFVCPDPYIWSRIYLQLKEAWEKLEFKGDEPPRPLILAAWTTTSDLDKQNQWKKTLQWAEDHDLSHLIPFLSSEECYYVEILSTDAGFSFRYDYHEPKDRPTDEDVQRALLRLRDKWNSLFLAKLASATYPLTFTGKKLRRLLVWADERYTPSWGSWKHIDRLKRKEFTKFRQKVNDTINPLYVDHIDFTCSDAIKRRYAGS